MVGTDVRIDWVEPDTHGSPIDKYEIMIMKKDGSFDRDSTDCPGIDHLLTLCYIPMNSIITLTNLDRDALI